MADDTTGMVRRDGPITSIMAAQTVSRKKLTVRQRVETFARFRPHGFIDSDLLEFARDLHIALREKAPPESTYRKRRTELTQENRIIADTEQRKNDHEQAATVYYHRDHVQNPPPITERPKAAKHEALREEIARLKAEVLAVAESAEVRVGEAREHGAREERNQVIAYLRHKMHEGERMKLKVGTLREGIDEIERELHRRSPRLRNAG